MPDRTCSMPDCDKPTRSGSADLCKMYYHRQYRHGDPNITSSGTAITTSAGRRYRSTQRPDHPIAGKSGRIYVHRMVLFDHIGPGPHTCHWCQVTVYWWPEPGQERLCTDHLNGIGDDNRIDNLVASCYRCNSTRALQQRSDALRQAGCWSVHDTIANLRTGGRASRVQPSRIP